MPYLHQYRLFISHAWRYSEGYNRILEFLNAAPNFSYSNFSIPVSRAFDRMSRADLQEQLRQQIRPAQTVVVLGGMYVSHSDWIQFEIDFARSLSKPILGIQPWAAQRMPAAVMLAATEIVAWNTSSITAAIRRITP